MGHNGLQGGVRIGSGFHTLEQGMTSVPSGGGVVLGLTLVIPGIIVLILVIVLIVFLLNRA
jgi:hypothetical protein